MKYGIVGSRNYPALVLVWKWIEKNCKNTDTIVTGGAAGVDTIAETSAKTIDSHLTIYEADWSIGKHAGLERNTLIAEASDIIICFWDGESRGCIDTVKKAKKLGKPYIIFGPRGEKLR